MRYTAVTKGDHDGAALVEAEGAAIRVEFPERGMGFGKGDYLVSEDGGETIYWVQPGKRRYVRLDLDRLAAMAGRIAEGIPGVFWIHIEEPEVYRLFEEETEPLLGYPTRHVRYLMTYRSRMRVTLPAKHGATEVVSFERTDGAIDPQRFLPPADFQEDRPKG